MAAQIGIGLMTRGYRPNYSATCIAFIIEITIAASSIAIDDGSAHSQPSSTFSFDGIDQFYLA